MSQSPIRCAVALDGGTTNTRARLWVDGRVVATARRAVGVRDTVFSRGTGALAAAVRDALGEVLQAAEGRRPEVIVAAGMLTADVGLLAVPHVVAPAGPAELAQGSVVRQLPEVSDQPILFVPGVRTPAVLGPEGWTVADVMRGEECETIGACELLGPGRTASASGGGPVRTAFLWPGSHTKLVELDDAGRILRSHTSLAGELTSALARHTLLAGSLPEALPEVVDADAADTGASLAVRDGLGRAAFLVRIAALSGELDAHQRASFLVGAVIADDVAALGRHPILAGPPVEVECDECGGPMGVRRGERGAFLECLDYPRCRGTRPVPDGLEDRTREARVWVGGRQPQRSLYARNLRERTGAAVFELDDELADRASATGALAVAREHGERSGLATG